MRKGLFAPTGILLAFSFNVAAIEVGSIADSRFDTGHTLDGVNMETTRAKLLEPANFGPGGTVPEAIHITDVAGPIDFTALSTFDVFFIGWLGDTSPNAFSDEELEAMQDWVTAGGTMVITCDDTNHDAVCESFGPVLAAMEPTPPVVPTALGATRPLFNGPFGTPTSLLMGSVIGYFENTAGYMILGVDQDTHPVILEALIGSGRVIILSDVDMITDYEDALSAGSGISNDNDRFLGNLFAYLASEAEETFFFNPGVNGNWWGGPQRNGEGAQLELVISGGQLVLVVSFYSYDDSGNQIFLILVGNVNGNMANVNVYITEGGLWGDDFDPLLVNETQWGTGMISTSSCHHVHIKLTPNAQYQALGYHQVEYDMVRTVVPAGPCPINNPDLGPIVN